MLKEAGHHIYPLVTGKDYSHAEFMVDSTRAQSPAAVSKSHHGPFLHGLRFQACCFRWFSGFTVLIFW